MTAHVKTIPQLPADQDPEYEALLIEGIRLLQQYAGKLWTDYNEHDPGLTILEELCYVIAELFQRAELPIADLLTNPDGTSMAEENAIYTASEILHNNPLTVSDYSKLIIDQVKGVHNAWVIPYYLNTRNKRQDGIAGYYNVFIDLDEDESGGEELGKLINKTLERNRNIGEVFLPAVFLMPKRIHLSATLYLSETASVEELLAEMLFKMEQVFKPGVTFYAYQQLADMGMTTDAIFCGPSLEHGFIPDWALPEKTGTVYVDSLMKWITSYPEVVSVANLALVDTNGVSYPNSLTVAPNETLLLDFEKTVSTIQVYLKNVKYEVRIGQAISDYTQLKGRRKHPGRFKLQEDKTNITVPQGHYTGSESYYSLQNEFPQLYGIGKNKLNRNTSELRKSSVLQLKAYLLFFEQFLADFLQHTAKVGSLFTHQHQHQTYFYQPLYGVPDVAPLLSGYPGTADEIYDPARALQYIRSSRQYMADTENEYMEGLGELYKRVDNFDTRRMAFLNHLLSRFNLNYGGFSSDSMVISGEYANITIQELRETLLRNLPEITSTRASMSCWRPDRYNPQLQNEYGLTKNLRALCGFKDPDFRNKHTEVSGLLKVHYDPENASQLFTPRYVSELTIEINPAHFYFYDILWKGSSKEHYLIQLQDGYYQIVFSAPDRELKLNVVQTTTLQEAEALIGMLVSEFKVLCQRYDNLYIIEHLQLMPDLTTASFAWRDSANSNSAMSQLMTYAELEESMAPYLASYYNTHRLSREPQITIWVKVNDLLISEYFFSSRISVFLPEGTDFRKASTPFRDYFSFMLMSLIPAHISAKVFWLNVNQYTLFLKSLEISLKGGNASDEEMIKQLFSLPEYKTFVYSPIAAGMP